MICIGSVIAAILCIVNMVQKRSIGTGSGEWFTRILSLVLILGAILFMSLLFGPFSLFSLLGWAFSAGLLSSYTTWGYGWIILLGVMVHGFDAAHL